MIRETFALLSALEQVAFEFAAEQADPGQIRVLEGLVKEMEEAITAGNLRQWAQKNIAFHWQIAEFSNLPLLVEFTHRTFDQWRRLNNYYFKDVAATRITYAQEEHWQILEQLTNKDVDGLISLARQHNQAALENYQTLFQEEQETT